TAASAKRRGHHSLGWRVASHSRYAHYFSRAATAFEVRWHFLCLALPVREIRDTSRELDSSCIDEDSAIKFCADCSLAGRTIHDLLPNPRCPRHSQILKHEPS